METNRGYIGAYRDEMVIMEKMETTISFGV